MLKKVELSLSRYFATHGFMSYPDKKSTETFLEYGNFKVH